MMVKKSFLQVLQTADKKETYKYFSTGTNIVE